MKIVTALIVFCFCVATSSEFFGVEITASEKWWNDNFFVKFNSPSGKTFYIETSDGTIHREKKSEPDTITHPGLPEIMASETKVPLNEDKRLPFISFVSVDFKIYDIYFESDDIDSYYPRLVETEFVYEYVNLLVRPSLDSFVGPNKKVYQTIYNDGNAVNITEKSPEVLDHFQIKTFGPYEKWEHTYAFSENGEFIEDHTISPIPVLANRSVLLPELEPNFIEKNHNQTVVKFNSPSGRQYYIRDLRYITAIRRHDEEETAYITFTEPNGRTYDIHIDEKDGHASLVEKSVDENYFRSERLYSFVAPNGILYRIDHKNESDHEVPVLAANSSDSSDLRITLMQPKRLYNKHAKYIFSDNGNKLFDRVDEVDWTPLNELPAVPIEEVTEDYVMTNSPFLSLYTPSGNNYHIFTTGKDARIVVEKSANHSQGLYISYLQAGKRKTNINFVPGADPYFEEEDKTDRYEDLSSRPLIDLRSFGTPDQKEYSVFLKYIGAIAIWKYAIKQEKAFEGIFQVKEPDNLPQANGLIIRMVGSLTEFIYRFTWNGDKLVEASQRPVFESDPPKLIVSLVGK